MFVHLEQRQLLFHVGAVEPIVLYGVKGSIPLITIAVVAAVVRVMDIVMIGR